VPASAGQSRSALLSTAQPTPRPAIFRPASLSAVMMLITVPASEGSVVVSVEPVVSLVSVKALRNPQTKFFIVSDVCQHESLTLSQSPWPRLTALSLVCSIVEREPRLIVNDRHIVNVVFVGFQPCCLVVHLVVCFNLFVCWSDVDLDLDWSLHLDLEMALEYERSMDIVVVMVASHLASRISLPVFPSRLVCLVISLPRRHCFRFFFQSSASAFVFDNVSYLGFFCSRWSNSKKGGVQGHNAN
jgi:hypothetical protein